MNKNMMMKNVAGFQSFLALVASVVDPVGLLLMNLGTSDLQNPTWATIGRDRVDMGRLHRGVLIVIMVGWSCAGRIKASVNRFVVIRGSAIFVEMLLLP